MNIPENCLYTPDHEWIKVDGEIGTIGVTDFAQSQLGDVVFVEVETEGETLGKGEVFGTIEAVKTVADMFMPVSGEVTEFNQALESNPELVNQDPYGKGWIVRIKLSDKGELSGLMNPKAYEDSLGH